ncbi:hypothetical protein chiPu_0007167 [Chiloscyllium punctatum]|uniref:Uncharacterized protein n=1 Tax=Chiloscyllium punctatum TaxID=137246 RepID=A0A401SEF1_CHIPU|nr:hypothetical protein [Chiloscyllium punctatum]
MDDVLLHVEAAGHQCNPERMYLQLLNSAANLLHYVDCRFPFAKISLKILSPGLFVPANSSCHRLSLTFTLSHQSQKTYNEKAQSVIPYGQTKNCLQKELAHKEMYFPANKGDQHDLEPTHRTTGHQLHTAALN